MQTTNNKDALMTQAVFSLAQGCGGAEISEEACAWFHARYYPWIDGPKDNEQAKGRTPQQVWSEQGKVFASKFRMIGERAAKESGGTIEPATLEKHALAVERESDCPWCPDK